MLNTTCPSETILFLDWISENQYLRIAKRVGHKWYKIGGDVTYSTKDLYKVFINEIKKEY